MTATITYSPLLGALCSNQWLTAQQISRGGHRVQAAIVAQQLLPDGMAQRLRLTTPPALALAHARPSYETDALPPPQLVYMEQPALGLATAHDAPPPLPHARVARPSRVVQATALKPHGPPTVPALDALPGGTTTRIDGTEYSTARLRVMSALGLPASAYPDVAAAPHPTLPGDTTRPPYWQPLPVVWTYADRRGHDPRTGRDLGPGWVPIARCTYVSGWWANVRRVVHAPHLQQHGGLVLTAQALLAAYHRAAGAVASLPPLPPPDRLPAPRQTLPTEHVPAGTTPVLTSVYALPVLSTLPPTVADHLPHWADPTTGVITARPPTIF